MREGEPISIILATYNRAHLIGETLRSISAQSYQNWECLIVDDGSKDETQQVVASFAKEDLRFRYYKRREHHKKGLPGSRNFGLTLAKGKYIVFFDDDDIPHPDCLKWSIEEISKNDADYCRYLRTVFFQKLNKDFDRNQDYEVTLFNPLLVEEMIMGKVPFNSCQVLWKAEMFKNEKFNEDLMFAEEWELYSRLLLKEPKGITIEKELYFGRKHTASNTGEFKLASSIRVNSKIEASKLIIDHTSKAKKLSRPLMKFFIRMGFDLQSYSLINEVLTKGSMNVREKIKYRAGYVSYPLIKPILKLKGFIKTG